MIKRYFVFLFLGFFASAVFAVEVTPTYQVFRLKKGEKATGKLTLLNTESEALMVTPIVKDWHEYPTSKGIKTESWLKIKDAPFLLQPNEPKVVTFTVSPSKKLNGEVMGMASFSMKNPSQAMFTFQLSVAMYASILETEKLDLKISGIAVKLSSHTEVALLLFNKGNFHLRLRGLIEIYDSKKVLVANAVLKGGEPFFPGSPKAFYSTIKDFRLPEGKYEAKVMLEDTERNIVFPTEIKKFKIDKEGTVEANK